MSVVAALLPSRRSRLAARAALLLALVVALVAGVMSGVARADDTGGFTPVDFSQAPTPPAPVPGALGSGITIQGSVTLGGSLGVFPPDVGEHVITPLTFDTPGRPALGQAHLFSRTSGLAPMTEDQYAGMVAMEDDAVAAVRDLHGISDTPVNHDLVIEYARDDVVAALYARLQQALEDPARSPAEQSALDWQVAVAQAHAVGAAQEARHQYDLWSASHCTYRPPAPYTDYDISQTPGCRGLRVPGGIPQQDKSPDASQFAAWGAAAYDAAHGSSTESALFAVSASEVAIAFGSAAGFLGVSGAAGAAATFLLPAANSGVSGVVNAILPNFASQITGVLANLEALTARFGAEVISTAIQGVTRFVGLLNLFAVLGPALIIAGALVQLILAGLDAFSSNRAQATLDSALDRARSTPPNLRDLMSNPAGQQQVFYDLAGSVVDCTGYVLPGECQIDATAPTRRSDDPVFSSVGIDDDTRVGPTADVPVSLGTQDHWTDTTLAIRDGWFVVGNDPAPQQTLRYVDDFGVGRTLRLVHTAAGGYAFQSLILPRGNSVANTGYDPSVADCTSHSVHDYCYTGTTVRMLTSDERRVEIRMGTDRAPSAPVVTASRAATVGVPVSFAATLPANTPADPDGDAVTGTWTAELDQPCVKATVGTFDWACSNPSAPRNGPHGGYLQTLPESNSTVVWNTPGTYRVTRTVTDPFGISSATSLDVVVAAPAASLFAACLQCDTTGGKQVQIAGRINAGAHRDRETVTIDWGDGTTTSGVPTTASPGNLFLSQTFWATIENSVQYQFQAVHTYAAGSGANRRITVSATDTGDGNPPPVTLAADAVPVVDPTSYGDIVSDRLVDYSIPVRLPVFVDSSGNRLAPSCTAPDGFGGSDRTVTDFTAFRTGVTFLVTCTATAPSGLATTVTFTVTTHQITATATASTTSAEVGQPVTFTVRGTTDDGRDVGDITDRVTMQGAADFVQCEGVVCSRTTTTGPLTAEPVADDNRVGPPVTVGVTPGAAAQIHVVDGGPRSIPVGSTVATPFSFVVQDAYGNPVPGTPVTLAVTAGTGFVTGRSTSVRVVSGADGVVSFAPSVGNVVGDLVVKATVNDDVVAQFTTTATSGTGLNGVSGNSQSVRVGGKAKPLVVVLRDADGNPVAGRRWAAQVVSGPATVDAGNTGTAGVTGADGTITVKLDNPSAAGASVIRVSASGFTTLVATFTATPNSAPAAVPDSYTVVARSGPLAATTANGVLRNDPDADGDPVAAVVRNRPRHGVLTLGRDGSFTYTPTDGYSGTDSFTYSATDGLLTSPPQKVTVTVLPPSADVAVTRDLPAAVDRGATFTRGVVVVDYGPSTAQAVVVTTTLPAGLTFGAVPAKVTLSADKRTATYAVSTLDAGAKTRTNLSVVVGSSTAPGRVTIRSTAAAPTTADVNAANNAQSGVTVVR